MTVLDNIRLGRHLHMKAGLLSSCIYWGTISRAEVESRKFIEEEIIDLLEIEAVRNEVMGMLPYGMQKRIELARALALRPEIILLDEPLAGLNLEEVEDMARFIVDINEDKRWNVTCVLVEHDMGVVMDSVRSRHGAQLRGQDCRWDSAGGPGKPGSHQGLSR